jgi:tyrosinase
VDQNHIYGYCPHVSNLFPTWHRPYLALYEQTMYRAVQFIVSLWPPGPLQIRYQRAAENFRMPYWDWAASPENGSSVLPWNTSVQNLWTEGPNGRQLIANPLRSFFFTAANQSDLADFPFYQFNETKRWPDPISGPGAVSNNSEAAHQLDDLLPTLQQRLYNLFANFGDYMTWSNEGWIIGTPNATFDSIESLHDTIHLAVGGINGHMTIIAYSSFDPLFILHHANVDRILAMWQILYNSSYVQPANATYPTRTIAVGSLQGSQSDLKPFFSNDTHFWNSDTVRDHRVFGYTYSDVANASPRDVAATINRKYTHFRPAQNLYAHQNSVASYPDWNIHVRINKAALPKSLFLNFFLDDAYTVRAGTLGLFAGHFAIDQYITGTVPLTSALVDAISSGRLRSLRPDVAEAFVKRELRLEVVDAEGIVRDPKEIETLTAVVTSSTVTVPDDEHTLASWGNLISSFEFIF